MGKLVVEVEIKSDGDLFFDLYVRKPYLIPTANPILTDCKLYEGEWGTVGCVMLWTSYSYSNDGTLIVEKETITSINKEETTMSYKILESVLLENYKSFDIVLHVDKKRKVVTWTVEYEKRNEGIPAPDFLTDIYKSITNSIDELASTK